MKWIGQKSAIDIGVGFVARKDMTDVHVQQTEHEHEFKMSETLYYMCFFVNPYVVRKLS